MRLDVDDLKMYDYIGLYMYMEPTGDSFINRDWLSQHWVTQKKHDVITDACHHLSYYM